MGYSRESVISILIGCFALVAWGQGALAGQDKPQGPLHVAASTLQREQRLAPTKPSAALTAATEHLPTVPKIHTRAFAESISLPDERSRALENTDGLEKLLESIACLAPALEKASNEEFASSLESLLQLRSRLLKPAGYGNLMAGMGVTQFACRLGLARLFGAPASSEFMVPIASRYIDHAMPSWAELDAALAEEIRGKMSLALNEDTSIKVGLARILQIPSNVPLSKDAEIIKEDDPYGLALRSLETHPTLIVTPYNLDEVQPVGLVVQLGATEYLIEGWVWWAAYLQRHEAVPETLAQVEDVFRKSEVSAGTNRLRNRPFDAKDAFGYLLMRGRLSKQATMFLLRGPRPSVNHAGPSPEPKEHF